ncbi:MAG: type III-A CRISPR-associated protein Cas10/Csm1 [Microcoleaceae cyanobacterium]
MDSQAIALQVIQQAILILAKWVEYFPYKFTTSSEYLAVTRAKEILCWLDDKSLDSLELLFDKVNFSDSSNQEQKNYCRAEVIEASDESYPNIPYPVKQKPDLEEYKKIVRQELEKLENDDWENLSLLTLFVEKYGSCLSFCEADISLIDMARSTAAVACALPVNLEANQESEKICLVAGDLSGIQKFIYTISSDGALKSLRARSFYLELVTEEVVQQLLEKLKLSRTSVIYAGGGNLYILASAVETEEKVKEVRNNFNEWLLENFQGKIFLALAVSDAFDAQDVKTEKFAEHWDGVIRKVNRQKNRKFNLQINQLLKVKDSYSPCKVCHRDDTEDLKLLNPQQPDSVLACPTCRDMFALGGELFKVEAIIRSSEKEIKDAAGTITFNFSTGNIYYHVFRYWKKIVNNTNTALLVNDWEIAHYQFRNLKNSVPLLLGNYAQKSIEKLEDSEKEITMRAGELAEKSRGIKRVGYLRMDVDNLGKIFARGLKEKTIQNLPRIAGISRLMTYFFKVYLNSLAENRSKNFINLAENRSKNFIKPLKDIDINLLTENPRQNLVFIYAGGDDLFVSGSWNEIVEFAFDVYQVFRAYTGQNPDITLSGGISLADYKFPLYQAAKESEEAEKKAKENGRDSLGLFGEVFKWDEWLGRGKIIDIIDVENQEYFNQSSEAMPSLFGVLPFVKKLDNDNIDVNYSRSFVRNLLATAQIQNQMIKEIEEKHKNEQYPGQRQDIRYYLHLPKIAYTLARLPQHILPDEEFRTSLKSPYNAPYFRAIATWIELLNRQ